MFLAPALAHVSWPALRFDSFGGSSLGGSTSRGAAVGGAPMFRGSGAPSSHVGSGGAAPPPPPPDCSRGKSSSGVKVSVSSVSDPSVFEMAVANAAAAETATCASRRSARGSSTSDRPPRDSGP